MYNLISVICHHGAAGSGGHYTCYSLNEQYDQWYEFDDQCVTSVQPDTVKNCEAYVLFYRYPSVFITKHPYITKKMRDKVAQDVYKIKNSKYIEFH